MLETQRLELERLGYAIVSSSELEVVGVRSKWYWDCLATHITSVVFLRATGPLSAMNIQSETDRILERARELDTFPLPVGFQHGRQVVPVYIADSVLPDAQAFCSSAQPMRFSTLYLPVAADRSTGKAHYLTTTPAWGWIYFGKMRWLAQRLLGTPSVSAGEPISVMGALMGTMIIVLLGITFTLLAMLPALLRSGL